MRQNPGVKQAVIDLFELNPKKKIAVRQVIASINRRGLAPQPQVVYNALYRLCKSEKLESLGYGVYKLLPKKQRKSK